MRFGAQNCGETIDSAVCVYCKKAQVHRNTRRHEIKCPRNPKSYKYESCLRFLILSLIQKIKISNQNINSMEQLTKKIDENHLNILGEIECEQFFKNELIEILNSKKRKRYFLKNVFIEGKKKRYFDESFFLSNKKVYKHDVLLIKFFLTC